MCLFGSAAVCAVCCVKNNICNFAKIRSRFSPKSTREVAARADNKIKYYVPTINKNCIALYRIHIDSQANLVWGIKRVFFCFFFLIAAKTQIRA